MIQQPAFFIIFSASSFNVSTRELDAHEIDSQCSELLFTRDLNACGEVHATQRTDRCQALNATRRGEGDELGFE